MISKLVTRAEPLVTPRTNLVTMAQISNADRTTMAIRVPKKYQFLVKGFVCWLKEHPNKDALWTCENSIEFKYDELTLPPTSSKHSKAIAEQMNLVFSYIEKSGDRTQVRK